MTDTDLTVHGFTTIDSIGVNWYAGGQIVCVRTTLDHSNHTFALNEVQQKDLENSARYIAESFARTLSKAFQAGRRAKARELWNFVSEGKL
jgi:hypothetical protein